MPQEIPPVASAIVSQATFTGWLHIEEGATTIAGLRYPSYVAAAAYILTQDTPSDTSRWGLFGHGTLTPSITLQPYIYLIGVEGTATYVTGTITDDNVSPIIEAYQVWNVSCESVDPNQQIILQNCTIRNQETTANSGNLVLYSTKLNDGDNDADISTISLDILEGSQVIITNFGNVIMWGDSYMTVNGTTGGLLQCYGGGPQIYLKNNVTVSQMFMQGHTELYGNPSNFTLTVDGSASTMIGTILYDANVVAASGTALKVTSVKFGTGTESITAVTPADLTAEGNWYDNRTSGLTATNVKAAIDELSLTSHVPAKFSHTLFVDKGYAGGGNNGSIQKPFVTITTAVAAGVLLAPDESNKVRISIQGGTYAENVTLGPHMFIDGEALFSCSLSGSITFVGDAGAGQQTSGVYNLQVTGAVAIPALNITGALGDLRLQFRNCSFTAPATGTESTVKVDRAGAPGTRITSLHCNYTHSNATGTDPVIDILSGDFFFFDGGVIEHADNTQDAVRFAAQSTFKNVDITGRVIGTDNGTTMSMFDCFLISGVECISLAGPSAISYTSLTTSNDPAIIGTHALAIIGINALDFVLNSNITSITAIVGNRLLAPNVLYDPDVPVDWDDLGGAPVIVREALDKLAAGVLTINDYVASVNARTQEGMIVQTNTSGIAGTWNDITAAVIDGGAGAENMFPGIAADNAIYVGSDAPVTAIGYVLSTAIVLGAGAISWEYWDGVAWTALQLMETKAADYSSNLNITLEAVGAMHLRNQQPADSALLTLNGSNKHWKRAIITTAITSVPVVDTINLFDNGIYNGEFFGRLASSKIGVVTVYEFQDVIGRLVGNTDSLAGPNTGIVQQNNQFANGAFDSMGFAIQAPYDIDTSTDITLVYTFSGTSTEVNPVEILFALAKVKVGEVADGSLPELTAADIIGMTTANLVEKAPADFNVEDVQLGDILQTAVGRDARNPNLNDLYTGNCAGRNVTMLYRRWK